MVNSYIQIVGICRKTRKSLAHGQFIRAKSADVSQRPPTPGYLQPYAKLLIP